MHKLEFVIIFASCFLLVSSQRGQNIPTGVNSVSRALDQFAINLLAETTAEAGDGVNVALSPYTVWSLMTIISEGAGGNTLRELEASLGLPQQRKDMFRQNYQEFQRSLLNSGNDVTLDITNAIFTTDEFQLNQTFQRISQSVYKVDVIPTNFRNVPAAVSKINSYISRATRNRIPNFVFPDDVANAAIFLTSALFFKGQWRHRFNKSATMLEEFFDENGNSKGMVEMMFQMAPYPYTFISKLKASAVELPYGDSNKMSMVILLPRKGVHLLEMLRLLSTMPVSELIDELAKSEEDYGDDDVHVSLPKFHIESEFILNQVLDNLGMKDVFSVERADLLGILPQYLYLSRVLQKAVIDVDEDGTVAAAASGGGITYKTTPPKLKANKPFVFLIIQKTTQSILFAGKVSNPRTLCAKCT